MVKQEVEIKTKKDEEDDQMQIDTVNNGQEKRNNYKDDLRREKLDMMREKYDNRPENLEKHKMAVEIFGDSDDEMPRPQIKDGGNNAAAE